jgi:type II secretory pathway component GspD/PulD (secretin)
MSRPARRGVIIFFHDNNITLKAEDATLEDICDAVGNLAGVKIIVDDILLDENISVDVKKDSVEELLKTIVSKIPFARHLKIMKNGEEEEEVVSYFVIFKKDAKAKEVPTEYINKKRGLQEAFAAKHNASKISGKLSVSGMFKLTDSVPYDLPNELLNFSEYLIEENKALLNLEKVTLKINRVGNDYIDYNQYHNDVVIDNLRSYAFQVKMIKKDGERFIVISNNTIPEVNTSVQPKITEEEAVKLVLETIRKAEKNSKLYLNDEVIPESIELKIMPRLDSEIDKIVEKFKNMSLYWSVRIDFYSYYVDAKTGTIYKEKSL